MQNYELMASKQIYDKSQLIFRKATQIYKILQFYMHFQLN